ncbi:hypothetical protein DQP58_23045 [Mycobacterium colombiense]|uniref:DinB family protein n=1 Tax=Mycobacterium colombiense TaxID=339268 RepID=A0A329K6J5_9MYCO|nr:DinB family protein [Mycobacterium colombiense]RAU90539.1 hypothetical protein DQP58_23045 [Mycobacterium colombiense]
MIDLKDDLHRELRDARAAVVWKLDGLSEYDIRRPMTPHGTNLLGLVKHLTGCEMGYFGEVFGRPFPRPPLWLSDAAEPTVDMWAAPDESRGDIVDLYRRACAHSDRTIAALGLEHPGVVPGWPEDRRSVTLGRILVHMLAETARHAGHADIVRELIDNRAGSHPGRSGLPDVDGPYWVALHERIERAARQAQKTQPLAAESPARRP